MAKDTRLVGGAATIGPLGVWYIKLRHCTCYIISVLYVGTSIVLIKSLQIKRGPRMDAGGEASDSLMTCKPFATLRQPLLLTGCLLYLQDQSQPQNLKRGQF